MVEVGGRAGGAPPSAAGLRVNRGADTTTAQGWPSTSTYRVGDQLISAPERFLGSVTEGQIDTLPVSAVTQLRSAPPPASVAVIGDLDLEAVDIWRLSQQRNL